MDPAPDRPDVVYECFAPFAHVPGRYEWCRIRSPTHGVFDTFIVLGASTAAPATVYVRDDAGAAFLRDRFPECSAIRVGADDLRIEESADHRVVQGVLRAGEGPLRQARMRLAAREDALPRQAPYGGDGRPVWGSRFTCWGVDLALDAQADGAVVHEDGREERLAGAPAVVTLGSFGRIAPR